MCSRAGTTGTLLAIYAKSKKNRADVSAAQRRKQSQRTSPPTTTTAMPASPFAETPSPPPEDAAPIARISDGGSTKAASVYENAPIPTTIPRFLRQSRSGKTTSMQIAAIATSIGPNWLADVITAISSTAGTKYRQPGFSSVLHKSAITSGSRASAAKCGVSSHTATRKNRRGFKTSVQENAPSGTSNWVRELSEYNRPAANAASIAPVSRRAITNSATGARQ